MASSTTKQILLADYMDSLASLPNELTRSFSDLRELDAVLRTSIETITRKILILTSMIETKGITPAERLNLLLEIAGDAQHLKMGTEDKIRVSGKACEELTITRRRVTDILGQIASEAPHFNHTLQVHSTTYPHVAPESLRPVPVDHNGRRKRVPGGSALITRDPYPQVSPAKKRRVEEDTASLRNGAPTKAATKPKISTSATTQTDRARTKPRMLNEPGSPISAEPQNGAYRSNNSSNSRNGNGRPSAATLAKQNNGNGRSRLNSRDENAASRRAGSNLLDMVASRGGRNAFDDDDYASSVAPLGKRGGSPFHDDVPNGDVNYNQPNGSGTYANGSGSHHPSSRAAASRSRATVAAAAAADEFDYDVDGQVYDEDMASLEDPGDVQGDPDEKKYCYCNRISFGQMVGCDDENCEKEWFHLVCIGHKVAPTGTWYCDDCKLKHQPKRSKARSGQKSGGGTNGGGRRPKARGGSSSKTERDSGRTGKKDLDIVTNKSKTASPVPSLADPDLHSAPPVPTESAEVSAKIEAADDAADLDIGAEAPAGDEHDMMDATVDISMADGTSIPIDPALSSVP